MSAILPQVIEPASGVVRLGQERYSQIQRKATARVRYTDGGVGYEDQVDPNVPAIPWTSGTGFGPSVTPPTTPGTVDLQGGYSRYVTFIEAGHGATQPMYVAAVGDWPAIAGSAGGRTVIPLDLWELHSWRYCGPEFVVDQTIITSGTYVTSGGVPVPASTDATTHGDYGYVDIAFDEDFGVGVVPDVVPASCDPDFVAWCDRAHTDNHSFRVYVRRLRPLTEPLSGELDLTIPAAPPSNAIDAQVPFGVTYDAKPVILVEVVEDASGVDGESQYQASLHDRSVTDFWAVIVHLPHPTPITASVPSTNTSGSGGALATATSAAVHTHTENTAPTYTQNAATLNNGPGANHAHTGPAHTHDLANHTHTVDVFPNETANRTLRVGWTAFGRRHAAATAVPVSWIARG